jgi:hypothetical protein
MPIATSAPTAPSTLKPNIVKVATKEENGIVVDTKYTPLSSLITYVSGASWTVDYYSQVVNKDNDLRSQDVGQSAIYQQYSNIKGLELKVVSPLSQSQDQQTKRITVTGSATVYPFLIPNEGDMFAADVGDGREGIFIIKSTERKSFLRETVYQIEYVLVYYSDADKQRRGDLDNKSIRVLHFRKDFLQHGQNPLLIKEEVDQIEELGQKFKELTKDYFSWFFNKEVNSLLVPGQTSKTYDHYVTSCILGILTSRDAPEFIYVRRFDVSNGYYIKQPQLFEALIRRDKDLLINANVKMGLVSTANFAKDPLMSGITYSGAARVVYPKTPDISMVSGGDPQPFTTEDLNFNVVSTSGGNLQNIVPDTLEDTLPVITHQINIDDFYVLSKAFYEDTNNKSLLEILVSDYLDNKAVDISKLLLVIKKYKHFGGLEKFYYIPIILILIKSTIRGL